MELKLRKHINKICDMIICIEVVQRERGVGENERERIIGHFVCLPLCNTNGSKCTSPFYPNPLPILYQTTVKAVVGHFTQSYRFTHIHQKLVVNTSPLTFLKGLQLFISKCSLSRSTSPH